MYKLVFALLFVCHPFIARASNIGSSNESVTQQHTLQVARQSSARSLQQRKAMAFLLGWNSKIILLRIPPKEHRRLLASMREYVRELNLSLKHPLNYYFDDPVADDGVRAQSFAEDVFAQLKRENTEIANHFGAAHNLLLDLAKIDTLRNSRAKLSMIATVLDIPPTLKLVPDTDPLAWAAAVKDHFEILLARPRAQPFRL